MRRQFVEVVKFVDGAETEGASEQEKSVSISATMMDRQYMRGCCVGMRGELQGLGVRRISEVLPNISCVHSIKS